MPITHSGRQYIAMCSALPRLSPTGGKETKRTNHWSDSPRSCEFRGSHCGVTEGSGVLVCDAVCWVSGFRRFEGAYRLQTTRIHPLLLSTNFSQKNSLLGNHQRPSDPSDLFTAIGISQYHFNPDLLYTASLGISQAHTTRAELCKHLILTIVTSLEQQAI